MRRTFVVTGASSGIGLAAAASLARSGEEVIAVGGQRSSIESAEATIRARAPSARLRTSTVDLADLADVRRLGADILARHDRIDGIVNAAGRASGGRPTTQGFELIFATNHLGPFLLTNILLDRLRASALARVVTLTSSFHRGVKNLPWEALERGVPPPGSDVYAETKVMNLLFTGELAKRLDQSGVIAIAFDPGFVRTNLGRDATGLFRLFLRLVRPFQADPETSGREAARLVMQGEAGLNGALVVNGKQANPSQLARDEAAAARLWTLSAALTGWQAGTSTDVLLTSARTRSDGGATEVCPVLGSLPIGGLTRRSRMSRVRPVHSRNLVIGRAGLASQYCH